jgi:hypothetical protein
MLGAGELDIRLFDAKGCCSKPSSNGTFDFEKGLTYLYKVVNTAKFSGLTSLMLELYEMANAVPAAPCSFFVCTVFMGSHGIAPAGKREGAYYLGQ